MGHNLPLLRILMMTGACCPAAHLLSGLVPATQTQGMAVGRSENPGVNGGHDLPPLIEEKLSCSRFFMMTGACSALFADLLSGSVLVTQTHSPGVSKDWSIRLGSHQCCTYRRPCTVFWSLAWSSSDFVKKSQISLGPCNLTNLSKFLPHE